MKVMGKISKDNVIVSERLDEVSKDTIQNALDIHFEKELNSLDSEIDITHFKTKDTYFIVWSDFKIVKTFVITEEEYNNWIEDIRTKTDIIFK